MSKSRRAVDVGIKAPLNCNFAQAIFGGQMRQAAEPSAVLEKARRRLSSALDLLEAAINRRREQDRQRGELDHARANLSSLEATNREVAQRLDQAVDTIRAVLEAQER